MGLSKIFRPRNILELGCGKYSTSTFLNKEIFPALTRLETLDTNLDWLWNTQAEIGYDPRFRPKLVDRMSFAIREAELGHYDLIFVDDSNNTEERSATIREISRRRPWPPVVVIHDYEREDYQKAAKRFRHKFTFRAYEPQTGVVWNNGNVDQPSLNRLEDLIGQYASELEPDDIESWRLVL